ncbi:4-hydroxybenzoate polyprenyl transferase [Paragonimus heterotremus]|uniref:4-hydroxybenzoate polyprenyltransferase, mitochondrial n=1 Tax=Paragonimus heterotremus TaxID=100268 RepID=A0A8J4WHA9_9TREM|nr:4-hydroxybenzoate polyprenyl transferase [Paragonimus heterotremus]
MVTRRLLCSLTNLGGILTPRTTHNLFLSCCKAHRFNTRNYVNLPSWLNPYVKLGRYDRPIGSWLLYLPCTWSIALATSPGHLPSLEMLALFGVGAVLMRGAGCTVNDFLDREFDKRVDRTKDRPLACGKVTPEQALLFLSLQLSASLFILLQLNWYRLSFIGSRLHIPSVQTIHLLASTSSRAYLELGCLAWLFCSLGLLFFASFAFNWGALLGYSSVIGHVDPLICIPLYIAGINWTLVYDTVYAFQDIEDDLLIGVKSLAILLDENTKIYLSFFHLAMLLCLLLVGINADAGPIYYAGTCMTSAHLGHLIYKTNLRNPKSCLTTFKAGKTTGLMYFATIVFDRLFTTV